MQAASKLLRVMLIVAVVLAIFLSPTRYQRSRTRLDLQAIGFSIYDYHRATGRWPTQVDNLGAMIAEPGLKTKVQAGSIVIVWHVNLDLDPKHNADAVLAYQNDGLPSWLGTKSVCWGDLRIEYMSDKRLQAALNARIER